MNPAAETASGTVVAPAISGVFYSEQRVIVRAEEAM